jgi:hypothetical protein
MDPYPSLRGVPGQARSVPVVHVPVNELILESEAVLELEDAFACYCDHGGSRLFRGLPWPAFRTVSGRCS